MAFLSFGISEPSMHWALLSVTVIEHTRPGTLQTMDTGAGKSMDMVLVTDKDCHIALPQGTKKGLPGRRRVMGGELARGLHQEPSGPSHCLALPWRQLYVNRSSKNKNIRTTAMIPLHDILVPFVTLVL